MDFKQRFPIGWSMPAKESYVIFCKYRSEEDKYGPKITVSLLPDRLISDLQKLLLDNSLVEIKLPDPPGFAFDVRVNLKSIERLESYAKEMSEAVRQASSIPSGASVYLFSVDCRDWALLSQFQHARLGQGQALLRHVLDA